jgi:gamma-glutamylcyclotransferase (GGCT)/AIG2-like uncharacterized protein YtfP
MKAISTKEPARAINRAMVIAEETADPRIITAPSAALPSAALEKLFVYGTLKLGCRNHQLMVEGQFEGMDLAEGLRLYDLGPFPMAIAEPGFQVGGEVYGVTASHLEELDRFEGAPRLYQRLLWTLKGGNIAWVYVGRRHQVRHVAPIDGPAKSSDDGSFNTNW